MIFKRHKLLNRRQRYKENLKQLWGALVEITENCDISSREEKWIRDIFINKKKNFELQRKHFTETLPPQEATDVALADEKEISNHYHSKTTSIFYSCYPLNNNAVSHHQNFNKWEPTVALDRGNSYNNCDGKFANIYLAVSPAKDAICTSCNFKGHFTKNCKSRRQNVIILKNHEIVNGKLVNPSDQPAVNKHVHKKGCCVINAWLETGRHDNDDYLA